MIIRDGNREGKDEKCHGPKLDKKYPRRSLEHFPWVQSTVQQNL